MTSVSSTTGTVWVAVDIAKAVHQVLVERPDGQRRTMRVANTHAELERLVTYLETLPAPCTVVPRQVV